MNFRYERKQSQLRVSKQIQNFRHQYNQKYKQSNNSLRLNLSNEKNKYQEPMIDQRMLFIEEFVEDLNKKVVLTNKKIKKILSQCGQNNNKREQQDLKDKENNYQRNSIQGCQKQLKLTEIKTKQISLLSQIIDYEKLSIQQLRNLLLIKDQQIQILNRTIVNLHNKILTNKKISTQSFKQKFTLQQSINLQIHAQSKSNNHKNLFNIKSLQMDTEKVNLQFQQKSFFFEKQNLSSVHINKQSTQSIINPQLNHNDPVFKIPCLSPTMLQMKCIQKYENQRRKKLRQLKNNLTSNKFIANQIQNLAAGVNSPLNQQMLNNAQNPLKNRFIRKPMSPILSSLSSTYKVTNNQNQQNKFLEAQASPILKSQIYENKPQPQTLNLPYFMSLKKKNKQTQK